jgi:hypothetical protein
MKRLMRFAKTMSTRRIHQVCQEGSGEGASASYRSKWESEITRYRRSGGADVFIKQKQKGFELSKLKTCKYNFKLG